MAKGSPQVPDEEKNGTVNVPGPKVVALGGGHGLYASLSALRRVTDRLTAVVTVADDGGSSGRLPQGARRAAARRPADGAGRAVR